MRDNKQNSNLRDSVDELIRKMESSPDKFEHHRIFLRRDMKTINDSDNEFLMISQASFGKVKLLELNCEGDFVLLKILDCRTNSEDVVKIHVKDLNPKVLFVYWKDIERLVDCDKYITLNNNSLLEFDFD